MKNRNFEADYKKAISQLEKLSQEIGSATKKNIWELSLSIIRDSAKNAPVDTGNLRRSHWVGVEDSFQAEGGIQGTGGDETRKIISTRKSQFKNAAKKNQNITMWIGNAADYSAEVNNTKKKYKGGRAGFFTDAIFENVKKFKKAAANGFDQGSKKI